MKLPANPPVQMHFDPAEIKVISGGQNGADQAGLRAARSLEITTGGWAPKGWITLDGPRKELLSGFGLEECQKDGYPPRTELNVKDSDVTLRFAYDMGSAGERCTMKAILKHKKPHVDLHLPEDLTTANAIDLANAVALRGWHVINVAGNSERTAPGIGKEVEEFMQKFLFFLTGFKSA